MSKTTSSLHMGVLVATSALFLSRAAWLGPPSDRTSAAEPSEKSKGAVSVGRNIQVSKALGTVPHFEVILASDPAGPKRLVASSMYYPELPGSKAPKVVIYVSSDGGESWEPTLERKDPQWEFADPALAYGLDGALYFANLRSRIVSVPSGQPLPLHAHRTTLQVLRSGDQGKSWGGPVEAGEHDRPFLAVDCTKGKYRGRLYCSTNKGVIASTDGGRSFAPVRPLPPKAGYEPLGTGNPVVLSDGTLVVLRVAMKFRPKAGALLDLDKPVPGHVSLRTSADGGESFSDERNVADFTNSLRGYSGPPVMAAGSGGAARADRIYVVWEDRRPEGGLCVKFAYSDDRGVTFSKAAVVSDQMGPVEVGRREGEIKESRDAFLPTVAVSKAGVVGITWHDVRALKDGQSVRDVRFRASLDGGVTWLPSVKVTEVPMRHAEKGKVSFRTGHTAGLAADAGGAFHALWIDGRTKVPQAWTAKVTVSERKD